MNNQDDFERICRNSDLVVLIGTVFTVFLAALILLDMVNIDWMFGWLR